MAQNVSLNSVILKFKLFIQFCNFEIQAVYTYLMKPLIYDILHLIK
jgi:hypothetical protein